MEKEREEAAPDSEAGPFAKYVVPWLLVLGVVAAVYLVSHASIPRIEEGAETPEEHVGEGPCWLCHWYE